MGVNFEIKGDREVLARIDRLTAGVKNDLRQVVAGRARSIVERARGGNLNASPSTGPDVKATFDSDGLGAVVQPVPAALVEGEAEAFSSVAQQAVNDTIGGTRP